MGLVENDEAIGIGVGERAQQRAVDHREHRRVRTDGERESDQGHAGKARILAERPKAVAEVLAKRFECAGAAGIATFLRDLSGAAELEANAAACLLRREAGPSMFFELAIEMEPEFLIETCVH